MKVCLNHNLSTLGSLAPQTIVRRLTLPQMSLPTLNPFIELFEDSGLVPEAGPSATQSRESALPQPVAVTGDLVVPLKSGAGALSPRCLSACLFVCLFVCLFARSFVRLVSSCWRLLSLSGRSSDTDADCL